VTKEYYLEISFNAGMDYGIIQDEAEDLLGYSNGSGYGFGRRDLSYTFHDLNSLKAAVRKVRRLPRRIKCSATDITDGDNWKDVSLRNIR
jgi:hypothetical protein